jgi:hypothetical protein
MCVFYVLSRMNKRKSQMFRNENLTRASLRVEHPHQNIRVEHPHQNIRVEHPHQNIRIGITALVCPLYPCVTPIRMSTRTFRYGFFTRTFSMDVPPTRRISSVRLSLGKICYLRLFTLGFIL